MKTKPDQWQPVLRAMLAIEARDLLFEAQADGTKKATLDIAVAAYGRGVEPVAAKSASWTVTATPADFAAIGSGSLLCGLDLPVDQPGPYMLRAAVLDRTTQKTGSAYELDAVPAHRRGTLTISSLRLSIALEEQVESAIRYERVDSAVTLDTPSEAAAAGAPPEDRALPPQGVLARANAVERVFAPGDTLAYFCEVFEARGNRTAAGPSLFMNLYVYGIPRRAAGFNFESGPVPVHVQELAPPHIARGKLLLPPDMEPGEYAIWAMVYDNVGQGARSQSEFLDFTVARPETATYPPERRDASIPPAPSPGPPR